LNLLVKSPLFIMSKKAPHSHKHSSPTQYKKEIIALLKRDLTQSYTLKQVYQQLKVFEKTGKQMVKEALFALVEQEEIHQLTHGRFAWQQEAKALSGRVDYVSPDFAYIIVEGRIEDIWISKNNLLGAFDKDIVNVVIIYQGSARRKAEGRVTKIIQRARDTFVGRIAYSNGKTFIVPDNKRFHHTILLSDEAAWKKIAAHDKVVVQITAWPTKPSQHPLGKILKVLGKAGLHEVEMEALITDFDLPTHFPQEVTEELNHLSVQINKKALKHRKDLRHLPTFTIDPEDAKDFDDALSFQILPNGNYEVGIHIADVSHYVKENTALDQEAFKRGTSIYLVDRTIPMLPEKLANELCSLKPNEDKFTFSAIFELNKEAQILNEWVGETIIHSKRRFSYEEAQQVIDQQAGDFSHEITHLNRLAKKIRQQRVAQGSINFETTEVKIHLDAKGFPEAIIPKIRQDTHKLIEEWMLLANRRVAEKVYALHPEKGKHTFVYRIHDEPDREKLAQLSLFVKKMGYKIETKLSLLPQSLNQLTAAIAGKPEQDIIQTLAIRVMAKAVYTTRAKPHFALAFPHYTHFTSPIRRYPDLIVHRLMKQYLQEKAIPDAAPYEDKCRHTSAMERRAIEAERNSIKYKQVVFMKQLQGQVLEGIISSLTRWGMYVEIVANKCEGMIHFSTMKDDHYLLDEKNFCIVGKRSKKTYHLGDLVQVEVTHCDVEKRIIDFSLVNSE